MAVCILCMYRGVITNHRCQDGERSLRFKVMTSDYFLSLTEIPQLMSFCGLNADDEIEFYDHWAHRWGAPQLASKLSPSLGVVEPVQYLIVRKKGVTPHVADCEAYCARSRDHGVFTDTDVDEELIDAALEDD